MTPAEIEILNVREKQERQLWAAVVSQALEDAAGAVVSDGGNNKNNRRRARDWFIKGGKDFREVCALADMDPDWIRANALKRIEEAGDCQISKRGRLVRYKGEKLTLKELSARTGVARDALYRRLHKGLTGEALFAPALGSVKPTITLDGVTRTLDEWSEITGVKSDTIAKRIRSGCTPQEALTPGRRKSGFAQMHDKRRAPRGRTAKLYEHDGKSMTLRQWSEIIGIPPRTLRLRLSRRDWSIEQALTTPLMTAGRPKIHAGAEARAA